MTSTAPVEVFIEAGRRRVFASALDWPGWCRGGRTEDLAVAALADYLTRYAPVALRAGLLAPAADLSVVQRWHGVSANADFGALGAVATVEHQSVTAGQGKRLAALLEAAWALLAEAAAAAPPVLPKGPRGGGRDRIQVLAHVVESELIYARKMGVRGHAQSHDHDHYHHDPGVADLRSAIVAALSRGMDGTPAAATGWPPRYGVRRIGWHVLDHAWELQDKSLPAA